MGKRVKKLKSKSSENHTESPVEKSSEKSMLIGLKKRTLLIIGAIILVFSCVFCSLVYTFSAWTITSFIQMVDPDYGVFKKNQKIPYEKSEFVVYEYVVSESSNYCNGRSIKVDLSVKNISGENIELANYSYVLKDTDSRSYVNVKSDSTVAKGILQPQRSVREDLYFCVNNQSSPARIEISSAKNTKYISIILK